MNRTKTTNYFLSQPHQPFFLLGFVNALVLMLLFTLAYKGALVMELNTKFFHVYSMAFLLFGNLFNGFLFTTFPRFNQSSLIERSFYTKVFYTNTAASLLFYFGALFSCGVAFVAMALLFFSQIFTFKTLYETYKEGRAPEKKDSFWILVALAFGVLGNLLFILIHTLHLYPLMPLAVSVTFFLYLLFLAFSVGQRMIPFFSHSWAQKEQHFVTVVLGLFVLRVFFGALELALPNIAVDTALALVMLREFLRWDFHPLRSPAILWVLHLALFWLPAAFGISAMSGAAELFLDTSFYYLNIHLLALGFLTTVLIGFGTRVTLGHAQMPPHADRFTTALFGFVQFVVLMRALFSISIAFEWDMNLFFDISAASWLLLFLLWLARYGKILVMGKGSS